MTVLREKLSTPEFQASLRRCCIAVGIKPGEDGTYQVYYERKKGFLSSIIKPVASGKESVSVAEVASELALTSRPENASDDEEGDGAISGEDSDAEA